MVRPDRAYSGTSEIGGKEQSAVFQERSGSGPHHQLLFFSSNKRPCCITNPSSFVVTGTASTSMRKRAALQASVCTGN